MREMTIEERNEILLRHGVTVRQEVERFPVRPIMAHAAVATRLAALERVAEAAKPIQQRHDAGKLYLHSQWDELRSALAALEKEVG